MSKRYLHKQIVDDLSEKMVFLGGPRQVGKTTLSKNIMGSKDLYLNWDDLVDRQKILKNQIPLDHKLIVLDEIHKYKNWRSLTKGLFDKHKDHLQILVTGSARLDYFRKGGDSLVGRYHYLRLHPLSLCEINKNPTAKDLESLLTYGGFPEPFFKQSKQFYGRWQMQRVSRVINQDLQDLEKVNEISLVELLAETLNSRVGSLLSIKSLQEDLGVSPHTVDRWITILENLYYCYRISPFGPAKIKSVKKAQKLYMWDWAQIENRAFRFENMVASHLLKFCHQQEDVLGVKTELRFFRNTVTEKEIDFIVLQKNKPLFAVECKSGDKALAKNLIMDGHRLGIPKLYQVHMKAAEFGHSSTGHVLPFHRFCELEKVP